MFSKPTETIDDHDMSTPLHSDTVADVSDREYQILIAMYMNDFILIKGLSFPIEQLTRAPCQVGGTWEAYIVNI